MEYSKKRRPIYKKRNRLLAQLPEFWKTVFTNHPLLSSILFDDDLAILGYCTEVRPSAWQGRPRTPARWRLVSGRAGADDPRA